MRPAIAMLPLWQNTVSALPTGTGLAKVYRHLISVLRVAASAGRAETHGRQSQHPPVRSQ